MASWSSSRARRGTGRSLPLSSGAQLGSQRALDGSATWGAWNGLSLRLVHPLTAASQQPVVPGTVTPEDIAVYATMTELSGGAFG
jgi:uncharacterized protein